MGDNQEGELLFRGPSVMKGYLNNPKANAETFTADGWMRTGDVGKYDSKTGEFAIVDRIKELIKFKGFQVAPAGKKLFFFFFFLFLSCAFCILYPFFLPALIFFLRAFRA